MATLALVAITVFDLLSVNRGHALADADTMAVDAAADPRAAALAPHARDGRVSSEGRLAGPNAASVLGLYDVTDSPLHFKSIEDLVTTAPEIVWWKILGVRYAVTEPRAGAEGLLKPLVTDAGDSGDAGEAPHAADVGAGLVPAHPSADSGAATQASMSGRAYEVLLPGRLTWVASSSNVVSGTWRPAADFDPTRVAVLDAADDGARDPLAVAPPTVSAGIPSDEWRAIDVPPPGDARLAGLEPTRIVVDANLAGDGTVVLATAFDIAGGWRTRAWGWGDGNVSDGDHLFRSVTPPVVRVDRSIIGVRLPAGRWRIEWTYRPRSVTLGTLVGLLGLIGLVAVTLYAPGAQRNWAGANGWPRLRRPRRT
ncbi:MAG: hypothetical protein U0470_08570 [Anaerolineae bacterium]